MINVQTIAEANAISNKIRVRKVANGYDVYVLGDVVPPLPQSDNTVPQKVTPRQIRLALNNAGLRETVENAVANSDQATKDWWEYSLDIERKNPLIISMATTLNITEQQLDNLFVLAATL